MKAGIGELELTSILLRPDVQRQMLGKRRVIMATGGGVAGQGEGETRFLGCVRFTHLLP